MVTQWRFSVFQADFCKATVDLKAMSLVTHLNPVSPWLGLLLQLLTMLLLLLLRLLARMVDQGLIIAEERRHQVGGVSKGRH